MDVLPCLGAVSEWASRTRTPLGPNVEICSRCLAEPRPTLNFKHTRRARSTESAGCDAALKRRIRKAMRNASGRQVRCTHAPALSFVVRE